MKDFGLKTQYQRKEENTLQEDFYRSAEYGLNLEKSLVFVGYFVIKGDIRNFGLLLSLARKDS
jgi:hypothetical protein